jgi:autotransporter-associated beta strand protein
MKILSTLKHLALLAVFASGLTVHAQTTYTWTNLLGGSWATAANWNPNLAASGSGNTADFSTLTLGASRAVTLDGAKTIGNMIFGDVGNTYNWTLSTGTGGPLTLAGSTPTITVNNGTVTNSLVLAGTAGITKAGAGTLYLTSQATYTGGTTVNAGTLKLGTGGSGGCVNGTLTIMPGATVAGAVANALGYSGSTASQVATLNIYGGTFTELVSGDEGYGLTVNLMGGTMSGSGDYSMGANALGDYNINTIATNITSVISATINTRVEYAPSTNQIPFNVAAGTASPDLLISGVINNTTAGTGIAKNGAGVMSLTGINTYSGLTSVNAGKLLLSTGGSAGCMTNSAITIAPGAELDCNAGDALGYAVNLAITNAGTIKKINAQSETLNRIMILTNGTITSTAYGGSTEAYNFFGNYIRTMAGTTNLITGVGNFGLRTSGCYFTNELNSTLTIACVVQGYGNAGTTPFNKMGPGRLKLTAANIYAGATVINGGTLEVDGSIANGAVTVNSGGTFEVDGSTGSGAVTVNSGAALAGVGKIYGAITVQSGGTLMAGTNAVTGTLSISNSLTLNAGSTNVMRINKTGGTPASDTVQVLTSVAYSGTLTVTNITSDANQLTAGNTFTLFNAASYSGGFTSYNLPALATGLSWNTSQLLVNGTISVISGSTPPIFNPPGGGYIGSVSVTISSDAGSTIYYTTDGSDPTTSGTVASGASPVTGIVIPVGTTETLKAYATNTLTHANASPVVSATYVTVPTGIWTNTAGGSWPVTANWNVGAVGNGSGITADFSTLNLTAPTTVTMSGPQTIGKMIFEDQANTYGWLLNGTGPLTMDAGLTVPSIVVSNQGVNISVTLVSSNGLAISGVGGSPAPGVILSSANNNFTNLTLSGVSVTNTTAAASASTTFDLGAKVAASTITVNSNATLNFTLNNIFGGSGMNATNLPTLVVNGLVYSTRYNAMPSIVLNGGTLDQNPSDTGTYNGYQFLGSVTVGGTSASLIKSENNKYDHLLGTGTTFNVAVTGVAGPDLTVSCGLTNASGDYGNSPGILIKTGAGTMSLAGASTYTGATIVSNGTLEVDGSTSTGAVAVNGGILDGTGTVGGPVTVNSGGTLAAGTAASMGTLTIGNTLHLAGTNFMRISKTGGSTTCDLVQMTTLTYGGTLVVTNITSDANLLAVNDSFQIFSANSSYNGVFTTLNLPPLPAGLFWDTSGLTSSGRIAVTANAPTPVFSPTAGGFVGTVTVTITSEAGAEIYYTTDGSDPTAFGPTVLSNASPATVFIPANTTSETITAFASVPAGNSGNASATYSTINIPTWITTSGSWSNPGNWLNHVIGNGIDVTADFSTMNLGGSDATVTLDIAPTIGNLIFADQGSANNWIIADGGVGPLTLAASSGSSTLTVSNQTTTLTAQLTGTNGLVKAGAGTLVLSNICTYTGNTVVNGGNLILATNNTGMGTIGGTLTVNPGATATATAQNALGYTNGTVLRTLQVTTLNLYGGTFNNASTGDNGWDLTVNMMGGTLAATGTGAHLAAGSGTVINTLATNVSSVISGIINTRENNPSNQIPFNVAAGTASPDLLVSGNINVQTAGVGITKNGPGVMSLAATNSFSGGTVVSNGVLQLSAGGGSLGTLPYSAITVFSPGELQLFTGDALGFTYSAARTLTLMGATLREINTNSETLARPTILSNATITAVSGAGLTASQAIIAQGTQGDCFNLYGATAIITTSPGTTNYISLPAGNNFALRGGSFTNGAGSYLMVNGVLNGWGGSSSYALTKTGAGTMILNSNNTYTGVTTVSNGTLEVDGSIASGAVTVGSGALLDGTGTINGSPTIQSGGTLMAGTLASIGTLSISNVLTLTSGGTTQMRISKTGGTLASDLLQGMISVTYGSTLTVSNVTTDGNQFIPGDVLKLFNSSSYSGTFASIQGLPALTNAFWSWDTSQLNINGTIRVITGAGTPTFNPPGGNYVGAQSVTITSDAGSTIFYTTDGSNPTTSGTRISGASPITGIIVPVGTTETINAYATNSGTTPSLLASETYVTVPTAIWTNTAGGSWPVGANWNLGVVGSGSGITADFSTLTLTANTTVTLNVPETIGSMLFEDHGSTYGWTLAGTGPLTMDAGITVPSIVVSNQSATISTPLAGTNGLVKAGSGLMNLTTPTTYSGATVVSNGVLKLSSGGGAVGTLANSPITVEPGAELQVFAGDALGYTYVAGKTLTLNGGTLREINTNSETLGRPITMNNGTLTANPGAGNTGATVLGDCYNLFNATAILSTAPNSTNYISLPAGCNFAIRGGSFSNAANSVLVVNGVVDGWGGSSAYALIKDGTGSLILNSNNTYAGSTVVSNGTLEVDGSIAAGGVAVNGGTLDGTGVINGPVTVNGGTLSAGTAAGIGTLAISNTLQLVSGTVALRISKTSGILTNDNVRGLSGALYGGTLIVTNVTSDATALAAGDKFTLFTSSGYLYNFNTTNLPALPSGLAWVTTNLTVDGSIAVVASVSVNTTPTNITATVSGNVLSLSWPADHTGWRLLEQTNNLASGISSNTNDWMTVPGSAGMNQTNIVINPAQPAGFYRLVYP